MTNITKVTKPVKAGQIVRGWHLVDVSGQVLGRACPKIAKWLQGKDKINYVPYLDMGDYVVVINAKKVKITGKKDQDKIYTRYSGYPGGLKKINFANLLAKNPQEIIRHAVSGMLPKNKHRDQRLTRLFIFSDEKHPYEEKLKSQKSKVKINPK